MRGIRAWDDVAKRMMYGKPEQYDDSLSFRFQHFETETPVYMWEIGLTDQKGTDVYEGDIVEGEHARYEIYWDERKAQFMAKIVKTKSVLTKNCSFPLWQYVEEDGRCRFEVIGNINEHPNLLGGNQG